MCAEHSRAVLFSTSFPASWPNRSFTCLKLSRSTNRTANASCVRSLRATSLASRSRNRPLPDGPPCPPRLRGASDLAPPEQLVARAQQRVVEAALARQDVHEPDVDAVHRHRPGDRFQTAQPAHLAEAPAVVRFLHQ